MMMSDTDKHVTARCLLEGNRCNSDVIHMPILLLFVASNLPPLECPLVSVRVCEAHKVNNYKLYVTDEQLDMIIKGMSTMNHCIAPPIKELTGVVFTVNKNAPKES
jgi:hypothetical protein